jgi:DNA polymerase (family 10)
MTNSEIARVFDHIATMLEMDGANTFRVRAYREAGRVVSEMAEPASALCTVEGRLQQVRGIGKDLESKIRDLCSTGTTALYAELTAKYPPTLMELTTLSGFGPKRVKAVFEKLGIRNRDDLRQAAESGALRTLAGFGETVEKNVLKSLGVAAERPESRTLIHAVWKVAHELAAAVEKMPGVERVEIAGSFRRRRETIGDLDLAACGGPAGPVMDAFVRHSYVAEVLGRGENKSSVRLGNGMQVDLRVVPPESYGAALVYFTGSKAHNIELRKIAIDQGMSLNEYALTRGEEVVASRTEEDVYRALGLAWVPPELREGLGEIALARENRLPRLIEIDDLRGDMHLHTDRSDGRLPLIDMVRTIKDRGFEYCAITDHSKALGMTRGFDAARVRQSVGEMEEVRRQVPGIQVLHGLEVDILANGDLDLDDESLALLDWVIVSLHSSLSQPREVVTQRVLRALDHPAVHLMGHPSGRKIGARDGADLDFERVFAKAAERGVAMEMNAQPDRMDLSDVNARLAKRMGLPFTIDTDGHTLDQLDNLRYGVFMARRAGLTREDVLNARPFAEFERWRRAKAARYAGGAKANVPATTAPRGSDSRAASTKASRPAKKATSKPPAAETAPAQSLRASVKVVAKTPSKTPDSKTKAPPSRGSAPPARSRRGS